MTLAAWKAWVCYRGSKPQLYRHNLQKCAWVGHDTFGLPNLVTHLDDCDRKTEVNNTFSKVVVKILSLGYDVPQLL